MLDFLSGFVLCSLLSSVLLLLMSKKLKPIDYLEPAGHLWHTMLPVPLHSPSSHASGASVAFGHLKPAVHTLHSMARTASL